MELKDYLEEQDKSKRQENIKTVKDMIYHALTHDGYVNEDMDDDARLTIQDLVTTSDVLPYITQSVRKIIMETVEPNLVIVPNCFTKVNIGQKDVVEIGAIGALHAGMIPEGSEFPKQNVTQEVTGQAVNITPKKFGLAVGITREVINDNQFDVIALWLRAAGAALARCKELQAMKHLINSKTIFVSHAPPYGILDSTYEGHSGSKAILNFVTETKPKLHLFGHIHDGFGFKGNAINGAYIKGKKFFSIDTVNDLIEAV